jgi:hypothetical protein
MYLYFPDMLRTYAQILIEQYTCSDMAIRWTTGELRFSSQRGQKIDQNVTVAYLPSYSKRTEGKVDER